MSNQEILNVKNLNLQIVQHEERIPILKNVSLHLNAKESLAIVGSSGAGKSLLAKSLIGLLPKNIVMASGEISLCNENLGSMTEETMKVLRGQKISMVFQNPASALNPLMRMGIQLTEGLRKHTTLSKQECIEKVLFLLEKVKIAHPKRFMSLFPFEISGGMKQRAAVVMALASSPNLIIADEPTTALDCISQFHLLTLLRELTLDLKCGLLLITHNIALLEDFCDRVMVMNKGVVVEEGSVIDVLDNPKHPQTISLINHVPGASIQKEFIKKKASLKKESLQKSNLENKKLLVSIKNLFYKPGSLQPFILKDLSLDLFKGECVGLVGASGCGKSTLATILSGLVPASSGELLLEGKKLSGNRDLFRSGKIRLIFQDSEGAINPKMSVFEIVKEPLDLQAKSFTYKEKVKKIIASLESVGLDSSFLQRRSSEMSGGQQQRVCIARALVTQPDCLICDEPLSSLDAFNQSAVLDLFKDIKDRYGVTLLFISHDLPTVRFLTDRIIVMNQGTIVEDLPSLRFFEEATDEYTRSLINTIPTFYKKDVITLTSI